MDLIVAKFGGTSLADAQAIRCSAEVARKQTRLGLLVVSAMAGTTDRLLGLARTAREKNWGQARNILREIQLQHRQAADELGLQGPFRDQVEDLLQQAYTLSERICESNEYSPEILDLLLSLGEQLSSRLMAWELKKGLERPVEWLNVLEVLRTNNQFGKALPILEEISRLCSYKLREKLAQGIIFVTQGFIGSTEKGATTTLGRGGSDYSAALLAEGVTASELQIWTDVPGVATTDPKICPNARALKELSFAEAAELATFGAKVLHPTTVWPARRKNIPIFVGAALDSGKRGTWIRDKTALRPLIRAIALRERQSILTLSTPRMVSTYGFLHDIFRIFRQHKVSVDLVSTSEISVAITVDDIILQNENLIRGLSRLGHLEVESGQGLVSLIGNRINRTEGLGVKILTAIAPINIRLLCSGASEHNFCFLVNTVNARKVVKKLHQLFLE